jgi:4-amino-4-deoxy-L-arabinose transferase-like glycosyltransferase
VRKATLLHPVFLYLGGITMIRLVAMWLVPLTDTTEARYGEIARKMVETSDWITLWHDYGVPFWAKPPLSTWSSALSMELFGINEFAARLPAFIIALLVMALLWHFSKLFLDKNSRYLSLIILASMALFYLASGTVMTDMALLVSVTLTLVSFWFAVEHTQKLWGYVFFIALGISLLAKGPAAVVLGLLPIFFWLLWSNQWKKMRKNLPWFSGIALMLLIGLPWYVLAEAKTPGFLNYFIVGEHLNRFLVSSWAGDLYGHAHHEPLGTIWLFLLVSAFPWVFIVAIVVLFRLIKKGRNPSKTVKKPLTAEQQYLWCWFLTPLVFFSFAHNIIPTYTLTVLPALALLISQSLAPFALHDNRIRPWVYGIGSVSPIILVILIIFMLMDTGIGKKSAITISHLYQNMKVSDAPPLNYIGARLYSMEFYNKGKVLRHETVKDALVNMPPYSQQYFALTKPQITSLTELQKRHFTLLGSTHRYGLYIYKQSKGIEK